MTTTNSQDDFLEALRNNPPVAGRRPGPDTGRGTATIPVTVGATPRVASVHRNVPVRGQGDQINGVGRQKGHAYDTHTAKRPSLRITTKDTAGARPRRKPKGTEKAKEVLRRWWPVGMVSLGGFGLASVYYMAALQAHQEGLGQPAKVYLEQSVPHKSWATPDWLTKETP